MISDTRALVHSKDVLHRMRAPYPAALQLKRYAYRCWAVDVVTYDRETFVSYIFGPAVDGRRLGPYNSAPQALLETKREIDRLIDRIITQAVVEPEPKKKAPRGTKRPPRKRKVHA